MASPQAARFDSEAIKSFSINPVEAARPASNVAIGYLRGFLVVLVLAHHSVIAYIGAALPQSKSLGTPPYLWRAFPVMDHVHSTAFGLFTAFNDDFFMSLMFFVSGLFIWSSLRRKGASTFVHDRLLRLGIPFVFAAGIVAPLAYYPSYLLLGERGVAGFIHDWLSMGDWPSGPAWFVSLLLAFDLVIGLAYRLMPSFGDAIGSLTTNAREHPARFFLILVAASAVAYTPMVIVFGPMAWTSVGPFQFQTARLFHYAIYLLAGVGVGAYGIERGLLAPDGMLARHWGRWCGLALTVFILSIVFFLVATAKPHARPAMWSAIGGVIFATICAALSFVFLALFVRYAKRRNWFFDSLSDNEYGMYLIHYAFVSWLQFAILSFSMPAFAKAAIVFGGTLLLSWGASAALRSIPSVRRIV
jgi:Acyltransferase family